MKSGTFSQGCRAGGSGGLWGALGAHPSGYFFKDFGFSEKIIYVLVHLVALYSYFVIWGDNMSNNPGCESAVRARVAVAWKKWRDIASLLVNRKIPLECRTKIYGACIRPLILYGVESWALTKNLEELIHRCDCIMLRCMAGVKWEEGLSNNEIMDTSKRRY